MAEEKSKRSLRVDGASGALKNLDVLEKKVAELRAAINQGQPLSRGKTNLLSGIMNSLKNSMGSW